MSFPHPALSLLLVASLLGPARAQSLPADFEAIQVPGSFTLPVGLAFSPSGSFFVIEQAGVVRFHDGQTLQATPFIDLSDEVNEDHDRGLLGFALHPSFLPDGGATSWVYLLYTVSPVYGEDLGFDQDDKYSFSRLTRYQATTLGADVVADLASRHVLLGNQQPDGSVPDCIASLHQSHSNGTLQFADDGSLLVAAGDGAHYDFTDTGGSDPEAFDDFIHPLTGLKGPTPVVQDSGAFRSQDLRSLSGKLLRLDPETGLGYPSNPFFDGDVASNPSRVWALGLRNPFRVLLIPGTGASDPSLGQPNTVVIGDVGNNVWEELSVCTGGENFGWPCAEGFNPSFSYAAFDPPNPQFPNCNTPLDGTPTEPLFAWHHYFPWSYQPPGFYVDESGAALLGFAGAAAIGGTYYDGGPFPDIYDGRVFFGDYGGGFIKTMELDSSLALVAIKPFAENLGQLVAIERHPITGDLYYVKVYEGTVFRIRYNDPDPTTAYGCGVNPAGSLALASSGVHVGDVVSLSIHNPLGTQSPGSLTTLGLAVAPDPAYPCGTLVPGLGMAGAMADGELLLSLFSGQSFPPIPGPPWPGTPATINLPVPYMPSLVGKTIYAQGAILDPTFGGGGGAGLALTEALEVLLGS